MMADRPVKFHLRGDYYKSRRMRRGIYFPACGAQGCDLIAWEPDRFLRSYDESMCKRCAALLRRVDIKLED